MSTTTLQLLDGRDHASEGAATSGEAVVTPVCRAFAKRMAHGALTSLPPRAATTTGVTEGEEVDEGVPATDLDGEGVVVGDVLGVDETLAPDDMEREGVTVGDVVAVDEVETPEGASAYRVVLSENTTVFPASMGELVMGCAVGVVKFHRRKPEEFSARIEPPDVPTTVKFEKCAGVTAPSERVAT